MFDSNLLRVVACRIALGFFLLALMVGVATPVSAQDADGRPSGGETLAEQRRREVLEAEDKPEPSPDSEEQAGASVTPFEGPPINVLELVLQGGWLMVPIALMSLVVVTFGIERALALRRSRVMPHELIRQLGDVSQQGSFDPRKAYRLCQQFPSSAANVIRAMLLKVGRPHSEVEHAVAEASEREAARLYGNVRTLNLAAAVTPLLGLLGTVFGMIRAFATTASMNVGANKAQTLAEGIYMALVTTAAGLTVAIPAAVLAHFFEGRIQGLLREIDELLFGLLPQVERFEGKLRVSRQHYAKDTENGQSPEDAAQEAKRRKAAAT